MPPAPGPARVKKHEPGEKLSPSGVPIKTVYRPEDAELSYATELADPGHWPFTRGVQPTMYRSKLWTMRMFAGFGTPEQTNERFHYLLKEGQTGLSTASTAWKTCTSSSTAFHSTKFRRR